MHFAIKTLKAMLDEAIFRATCNATNVALQVARENSRVTPHFATAIVALRVAEKSTTTLYFLQRCETSCLRVTSPQQLATQFCKKGQSELILARPPSCLLLYALQVAKKVAKV